MTLRGAAVAAVIDAISLATDMGQVAAAVATLAAVYVVSGAALLGQTSCSVNIGARVAQRLRAKVFSAAMRARLEALAPVKTGLWPCVAATTSCICMICMPVVAVACPWTWVAVLVLPCR